MTGRPSPWAAIGALWRREIRTFVRDRARVAGTIGQPLVLWGLLGVGFGGSFAMPGDAEVSYLGYLFPGIVALVVLFAALFASMALIEDRDAGVLQALLVAPVSRTVIVAGLVAGGATLALAQGLLVLAAAPWVSGLPDVSGLAVAITGLVLLSVGFCALGVALAWRSRTTRGFHALMNLVLIPLWAASGAVFPPEGLPPWLRWIVWADPAAYGVAMLRWGLGGEAAAGAVMPLPVAAAGAALAAALALAFAVATVRRPLYR